LAEARPVTRRRIRPLILGSIEIERANQMATQIQSAATPRQACFRHLASGTIVNTGCFHDITRLPGGDDVDLDQWEAGFTDDDGRFYDRREAARLVGIHGRLESASYFAGDATPTLEAGHLEAWRKPLVRRAA
jgi:hypothetical protein